MEDKEEVVEKLKQLWGPRFIQSYIPIMQRPYLGRDDSRPKSAWYEWNPQNWPLPILKAMLVIAKLTSDKKWVRTAVENVVKYRTGGIRKHTLHVIAADCEVIEIMLVKKWKAKYAFKMHQKDALVDHKKQDESDKEIKHVVDNSREIDDGGDVHIKSKEAGYGVRGKTGHDHGSNAAQRGEGAVSGKAQPMAKHPRKNVSEPSLSVPRSVKQKKRKRSAVDDGLLEATSIPVKREDLTGDHTSGHSHAKYPSYDTRSSFLSSLPVPSPPPRSSTTKFCHGKPSRYGMFPPPPPRTTTPSAQNTSEPENHSDKNQSSSKKIITDLTISPPDYRKDTTNARFKYNDHNENEDEDEDDDQHIFNTKIAVAEAELNLARLRAAAAESAARKVKRARTSVSSRGNSTSSF